MTETMTKKDAFLQVYHETRKTERTSLGADLDITRIREVENATVRRLWAEHPEVLRAFVEQLHDLQRAIATDDAVIIPAGLPGQGQFYDRLGEDDREELEQEFVSGERIMTWGQEEQ